jgi:hypothetical protein
MLGFSYRTNKEELMHRLEKIKPNPKIAAGRELLKLNSAWVDFDCRIDAKGLCKQTREDGPWNGGDKNTPKETNCCVCCARAAGYIWEESEAYSQEDTATMLGLFDEKLGFWRARRGCILPRRLRSGTCVSYACLDYEDSKKNGLFDLREQLFQIKPTDYKIDYARV